MSRLGSACRRSGRRSGGCSSPGREAWVPFLCLPGRWSLGRTYYWSGSPGGVCQAPAARQGGSGWALRRIRRLAGPGVQAEHPISVCGLGRCVSHLLPLDSRGAIGTGGLCSFPRGEVDQLREPVS